jgi:type VI protein secretion system component VasK
MQGGKDVSAMKKYLIMISRWMTATLHKIGTLNLILILVGVFLVWFNSQMLDIFRNYGTIPETYAVAVIGATIGEAGICGWIRTTKDRKREHDWDREDKKEQESEEPKG